MEFSPASRYLSVHGPIIDSLGEKPHNRVSDLYRQCRIARDGPGHHITFINHLEIASLPPPADVKDASSKQKKKIMLRSLRYYAERITSQFGEAALWRQPVDLGLGSAEEDNATSYFRVLHWPLGQHVRSKLNLPPTNFHITVGFEPRDVHLYKGPGSLLCLNNEREDCTMDTLELLTNYATYYFHDKQFIHKLYLTCLRKGAYKQVFTLTRLYLICKMLYIDLTNNTHPFFFPVLVWLRGLKRLVLGSKDEMLSQSCLREDTPLINVKI